MYGFIDPPILYSETMKAVASVIAEHCKKVQDSILLVDDDKFELSFMEFYRYTESVLSKLEKNKLLLQPTEDEVNPVCYCIWLLHKNTTNFTFTVSSKQYEDFGLGEISFLVEVLPKMEKLIILELPQSLVTNEVLKTIGENCQKIEDLRLNGNLDKNEMFKQPNRVTPAGIVALVTCRNIRRLYLPEYIEDNCCINCSCYQCCQGTALAAVFTLLNCLHDLECINYRGIAHVINLFGRTVDFALTELELEDPNSDDLEGVRDRCLLIKKLKLSFVQHDSDVSAFNEAWYPIKFNKLTELEIEELPVDQNFIRYLKVQGANLISLKLTVITGASGIIQIIGSACPLLQNLALCDCTPTGNSFVETEFDSKYRRFEHLESLTLTGIMWNSLNVLEKCLSFASGIRVIKLDNFTGGRTTGLLIDGALRNINCYNEFEYLEELSCYSGLFLTQKYLSLLTEMCPRLQKVCVSLHEELKLQEVESQRMTAASSNMALLIEVV